MGDRTAVPSFGTVADVRALVRAFEDCTLPKQEWNHGAHLAAACWYLRRHGECDAARRMISGIRKYNHAQGIRPKPKGGYHETITLFWIAVVHARLQSPALRGSGLLDVVNDVLDHFGGRPWLVSEFYTPERLWSAEARSHWVPPDLRSLDDLDA